MTKMTIVKEYSPSEKEEYMNSSQLEYFKQRLLSWKEGLLQETQSTIDRLKDEKLNESDPIDKASVEMDTISELRTRDRYRRLISKIDYALRRIEDKTYGYCEETGEEIGLMRLEARPIATLCIEAQERYEKQEKAFVK